MKIFRGLFTLFILLLPLKACHEASIQPQEPRFFTRDIALFWLAFDGATNLSSEYFQQAYIDQGTLGLRDYVEQKNLAAALPIVMNSEAYRDYYLSVRENTLDVSNAVERSKQAFEKLREIYSGTRFYNVYFLVGAMGAGGRISNNGLLVAVEMFSRKEDAPTDRLAQRLATERDQK